MLGFLWLLYWQSVGIVLCRRFLNRYRSIVRLWLGSVFGSALSQWAPIPFAFLWGFSFTAHAAGALLGTAIAAACLLSRRNAPCKSDSPEGASSDRPLLYLLPPFWLLSVVLVLNHTLLPVDGGMYTGQCTYGDMAMHLGFITSLAEQKTFPPYYNILPTARICYPFLCDSVSASLYLLGTPLRWAYMLPMFLAFAQVYTGVWFLAGEICRKKSAPILAFLFFFLNGGLGMIYFIRDYSLHDLFTGFYKTPTNLTEKGMRWVNVIADMLLPQRATLFGWAVLMAALYLLFRAVYRSDAAAWLPAGLLGGALPMIHTHSFLALGLTAACWMVGSACREGINAKWLANWCRFGLTAVALAVPQLLLWTFRSVGGNESFLRLGFDWVNGGKENFFWFWLKNVGPVFIIAPIAYLFADNRQREIYSGAILLFVLCELVIFQPNTYDNNKLLYIAYLFACFLSADAVLDWLEARKSPVLRSAALVLLLLVCGNAAVFTLAREVLSGSKAYGYELFSADEVKASEFIRENTEADALFLTDDNHDNPVAVLTGRNILCGSPSYLYFHGLDYADAQRAAQEMLTSIAAFEEGRESRDVDYVFFGYAERAIAGNILSYYKETYPMIFSSGSILIFDVR
ncbi:MAG: hypothetical protein IKO22_02705 [Oscillospiraceae bacterium]|nr:hypothetical protein [Oscillospiraceae bacterium]